MSQNADCLLNLCTFMNGTEKKLRTETIIYDMNDNISVDTKIDKYIEKVVYYDLYYSLYKKLLGL
mgnify:CR=1 FL=1